MRHGIGKRHQLARGRRQLRGSLPHAGFQLAVVLFRFGRSLSHGGIVLAWPLIIHAYMNERAVVVGDVAATTDLMERWAGTWTVWPKEQTDGR